MGSQERWTERFDRDLESLLSFSRPECFWAGQRARISGRIDALGRKPHWGRPVFLSALAGVAAGLLFFMFDPGLPGMVPLSQPRSEVIPPSEDWDFLEKLPLLEHWEEIQSIKKGRP